MAGFDFDTDCPAAEPWDFTLTFGGVAHATLEPSAVVMAGLIENPEGRLTHVVAFFRSAVPDPAFPADTLNTDQMVEAAGAILRYLGERMERTRRRHADATRRAEAVGRLYGDVIYRSGRPLN